MIGDFNADDEIDIKDIRLVARCIAGGYDDYDESDYYAVYYIDDTTDDLDVRDMRQLASVVAGGDSDRVWYYADLYYDESEEMYLIYGDLYE